MDNEEYERLNAKLERENKRRNLEERARNLLSSITELEILVEKKHSNSYFTDAKLVVKKHEYQLYGSTKESTIEIPLTELTATDIMNARLFKLKSEYKSACEELSKYEQDS